MQPTCWSAVLDALCEGAAVELHLGFLAFCNFGRRVGFYCTLPLRARTPLLASLSLLYHRQQPHERCGTRGYAAVNVLLLITSHHNWCRSQECSMSDPLATFSSTSSTQQKQSGLLEALGEGADTSLA